MATQTALERQTAADLKSLLTSQLQLGTKAMLAMSEQLCKAMEATQHLTSTNDAERDPFAQQGEAELALPSTSYFSDPDWIGDDNQVFSHTARKDPILAVTSPVTVYVCLNVCLISTSFVRLLNSCCDLSVENGHRYHYPARQI